jgi:topoisomerase (DNA) II binding protein 1
MQVVLYGDFDAKNALRRVIAAGGGQVAASAPPFTAAIELGLACAVVDPTKGKTNRWVRELTAAGVPCVHPDLFVDWLARPSVDPTQHLLHGVSLGPRLTAALARSLSVHTGGAGAAGTAVAAR